MFNNKRKTRNSSHHQSMRPLQLESMEERRLMAADIYIDVDGASRSEFIEACSSGCPPFGERGALAGFKQGFTFLDFSLHEFLDFDNNRLLDANDGFIASQLVLKRVREDFAPYDVRVMEMNDSSAAILRMRNNSTADMLVFAIDKPFTGSAGDGRGQWEPGVNIEDNTAAAHGPTAIARKLRSDYRTETWSDTDLRDALTCQMKKELPCVNVSKLMWGYGPI